MLFPQSLLIGLSIAAPVGPIGVLCIQRTLASGPRIGFATGLGAACADGVYGALGAFGASAIIALLVGHKSALAVLGGLFLVWLGVVTWRARPAEASAAGGNGVGPARAFASTFALTLANPMTILSFIAVFTGLAATSHAPVGVANALVMVAGVFLGSALWWAFLSASVGFMRHRVSPAWLRAINRASASILIAFGLYQLTSVLR